MAQTRRPQHPNAALTPAQRLKMARLVTEDGWSAAAFKNQETHRSAIPRKPVT